MMFTLRKGLLLLFFSVSLVEAEQKVKVSPCLTAMKNFILSNQFGDGAIVRSFYDYTLSFGQPFLQKTVLSSKIGPIHVMGLGEGEMVASRQMAGVPVPEAISIAKPSFFLWNPKQGPETALTVPLTTKHTQKLNVTAVSAVTTDTRISATENFQPFSGKFFEDIPTDKLKERFGLVDVFEDNWGVLAYTATLSEALNKILNLSKKSTTIFLKVKGRQQIGLYGTMIKLKNGKTVDLPTYFKNMSDVLTFKEYGFGGGELVAEITFKVDPSQFHFPALKLIKSPDTSEVPPRRLFVEI